MDLEKGLILGTLRPSNQRGACVFSAVGLWSGLCILMAFACIYSRRWARRIVEKGSVTMLRVFRQRSESFVNVIVSRMTATLSKLPPDNSLGLYGA